MKMQRALAKIVLLIFFALLLILIYQIIVKLTGHSPSLESILTTAVGLIISFLLAVTLKIGEFMGETRAFMGNARESFHRIREDIRTMQSDIKSIKNNT